ncbi:MAG: cytochrome c3 family protein [bacterium]|nr:cytochrome c3 family protein [bacterium]
MNVFELLCMLAVAVVAALLLLHRRRDRKLTRPLVSFAALVGLAAGATFPGGYEPVPTGTIPYQVRHSDYVTSKTCRNCHPDEHRSWHRTFHRTMAQVVTPETVVADFNNSQVDLGGVYYQFVRRGDTYWVDAKSPGAPLTSMRVLMSTGSHHYQVYWVESPRHTEPFEVPLYWNIELARWVPKPETVIEPPGTPDSMGNWSYECIRCHSTGGVPGYDPQQQNLNARVAEFGISCEACHGPGRKHVEYYQNPWNRYRQRLHGQPDSTIVNPARLSKLGSTYVCGRCHSNFLERDFQDFMQNGFHFLPGDEDFSSSFLLSDFDNPISDEAVAHLFWKDGTCRTGGDELNGHVKSPCFQQGQLTCISCHSMHDSDPNDQLAAGMQGNQACLQCHDSLADDISAHTHHAVNSSGSLCYNCHMPHTSYALSTAMRSHRIDSPSVKVSAQTGRPNACNLCHVDRTLQWSAEHLSSWFGAEPVELSDEQQQVSANLLWLLKGNAIQRAIAAWHMGWEPARTASGDQWQAPFLAKLLQDPYAQVRLLSSQSLMQLPGFSDFEYDFLDDSRELMDATSRGLKQWQPVAGFSDAMRDALLLDAQGQVDWQRTQRLLDQRDDSPVSIRE